MISFGSLLVAFACCKLAPTLARKMWRHNYVIDRTEYLIFTFSESINPWVYSLQFLFKSPNNSWRYERKCEWVFFSEHVYMDDVYWFDTRDFIASILLGTYIFHIWKTASQLYCIWLDWTEEIEVCCIKCVYLDVNTIHAVCNWIEDWEMFQRSTTLAYNLGLYYIISVYIFYQYINAFLSGR